MKKFMDFSADVRNTFDNNEENYVQLCRYMNDAANRIYTDYNASETDTIIRKQINKILGINYAEANQRDRRIAWKNHGKEVCALVEEILIDRNISGWTDGNTFFETYVETVNTGAGDQNEFYVEDNSLLVVSKFAGSHLDIVRQAVKPGKAFSVDTDWYTIKVYADFQMFMLGRVDFPGLIDRMNKSVDANRKDALYNAFMSIDGALPTDMVLETAISVATKPTIIDQIELVKSVVGTDVLLVGAKPAISKLQSTVAYDIYSEDMKNEVNKNGIMAFWEGYNCYAISRVNKAGTRTNILDNDKIYILPVDPNFKPVKRIVSGDMEFIEDTDTTKRMDRTVEATLNYEEGYGVVVNELFGLIKISTT